MVYSQLLVNGLIDGAIYALVAAGFSLIYSTNRFIHFAHGATLAAGAYFLYWTVEGLGLDLYFGLILLLLFAALFGAFMNTVIYKKLRERNVSPEILLIASIALALLMENVILAIAGAKPLSFSLTQAEAGIEVLGAYVTPIQLYIMGMAFLLLILLYLAMKKTSWGKYTRAVADNPQLASIQGISHERVYLHSFIVGSVLAGIAGALIGLENSVFHTMGTQLVIKGFAASVIGGIVSVPGAIVGSFILGLLENIGIFILPTGYKDAIAFALLFVFLLVTPNGLFGPKQRDGI